MRKKSKYKPRQVLLDNMSYVKAGVTYLTSTPDRLNSLKIKNHLAMSLLVKGEATRSDITTLITMSNMCEALKEMGFGSEYEGVCIAGRVALLYLMDRGIASSRFTLKAVEMKALNSLMELHDAQMEVVTGVDIERAMKLITNRLNNQSTTIKLAK